MVEILRVLVVDDERGMRLGVKRALSDFTVEFPELDGEVAFQIDEAADGEQAHEKLQGSPPDILLLDHKLPDTSGLEILDELASRSRDLLTVMITAYASLETAITATKRGAFDFLAKPFTPQELREVIRKAARHFLLQREARRLAEEKRVVRFEFVSVLAHEMKAPLSAVEGYLRIIRERAAGDDPSVYHKLLDRSLSRLTGMRKLMHDLLDLTAIESGRKPRRLVTLDVTDLAREVMEDFELDAGDRSIALRLVAASAVRMIADKSELEIILNNLISNAVTYNRDNGNVEVRIAAVDDEVRIEIEDTGIGMSPDETQKLFQDFVRIRNAKTRNIQGSGLGLSIVKKIALQYGGRIEVRSEPDVGTTFAVMLQRDSSAPVRGEPTS